MSAPLQNDKVGGEQFATTCWNSIRLCASVDDRQAAPALAVLCARYHPVLLACVRLRAHPGREDAEDLTQGFFAHMLEHGLFLRADPARGRFRAFLLTSLRHYLHGVHDWQNARKRGGGQFLVPLDEANLEGRAFAPGSWHPFEDAVFDRCWAETLTAHALDRLVEEYSARGKKELVRRSLPYLHGDPDGDSYERAASGLGINVAAFRSALNRVRVRHRQLLREAVAETVSRPEEIDAEIRYLCAALEATPPPITRGWKWAPPGASSVAANVTRSKE